MGVDDWSTNEAKNASLGNYDVSRGECPDASTSEHARELMANIKALSDSVDERFENFVGENIEVDGITIENNEGTLTVVDVAIGGDTEELLTDKIAEIEAAAETASGKASDAETAAGQAADSATAAVAAVSDAVDAANLAAAQATQAASAAARAQAGAALAESAVQAVVAGTNLNWQKSEKAASVAIYPVPETVLEPVVTFAFTETDPAEGEKGPDNPSTITGVSSITVTRCETVGVDSTDYAIDLGNTYYGGSIDLATGVMTVTWAGKVLTDSDANRIALFGTAGVDSRMVYNITQHGLPIPKNGSSYSVCSHSNHYATSNTGVWGDYYVNYATNNVGYFVMQDKNNVIGTTAQAYSNWIASQYNNGTPVTFSYAVADPFTVQLSPTQIYSLSQPDPYIPRINTVYTDASAVQVGYAKSPIRSEYELTQAILATEGGE